MKYLYEVGFGVIMCCLSCFINIDVNRVLIIEFLLIVLFIDVSFFFYFL